MALSVVQSAIVLTEESLVTAKTAFGPGAAFTVGSGGNRALLFAIYAMDAVALMSATTAPTITATFNGAAVSILAGTYRYHSGDRVWQVLGYLPAPPSGAGTLSVTASSGQWSMWAIAAELTDAHQTTMPARLSSNTLSSGTSQTASGTTTVNGSMLFGAIGIGKRTGNPSTAISVTDGTSDGDGQTGTTDLKSLVAALAHKTVPTAGAASVAFSWTGSARFGWQTVEVFEQVASGGGQTITLDAATSAGVGQTIDIVTGATYPLSIDALPFAGFVFDCARQVTATVRISGKGTTGNTIQARGASPGKNTAWQSTTVDGSGNWAVSFAIAEADWDVWYTPEARIGTDDGTKISSSNDFGCGDVIMPLGQSQPEQVLNPSSVYSTGYTFPTQTLQNLTMVTQLTSGGAWTYRKVTSYTLGHVNIGMAAMANVLALAKPNRKTMIVDGCQSGTSIYHLASDAESTRVWSDFTDPINLIRAGGSDIGVAMLIWQADDAGIAKTYCVETAPIFIGQRWGGGAFTVGTTNPDGTSGLTIDHILWDAEAATSAYGRGIFTRDRTKLVILEYPPFNDASTTTEEVNFTSFGGRAAQLDRPARDQLRAMHADSRYPTVAGLYGPGMHIADFGADVHPARDGAVWGMPQWGVQFAAPILAWQGYPINDPTIIDIEEGVGGAYADVIVDMPPTGVLTTIRALKSLADPTVPPPHYQPVMGFEIRRNGNTDAQRRPVFKASETSYPAAYRGTVTITDSGTGTWPMRRARIRITPTTAFATGDGLEFLRGEAMAVLLEPRDTAAQTWLDLPIAHIPALYDAAAPYPYYGIPVRPQPDYMTMTVTNNVVVTLDAATSAGAGQTVNLQTGSGIILGEAFAVGAGQEIVILAQRVLRLDAVVSPAVGGEIVLVNAAAPASSARWATPEDSETTGTFGEYRT